MGTRAEGLRENGGGGGGGEGWEGGSGVQRGPHREGGRGSGVRDEESEGPLSPPFPPHTTTPWPNHEYAPVLLGCAISGRGRRGSRRPSLEGRLEEVQGEVHGGVRLDGGDAPVERREAPGDGALERLQVALGAHVRHLGADVGDVGVLALELREDLCDKRGGGIPSEGMRTAASWCVAGAHSPPPTSHVHVPLSAFSRPSVAMSDMVSRRRFKTRKSRQLSQTGLMTQCVLSDAAGAFRYARTVRVLSTEGFLFVRRGRGGPRGGEVY
jgi:hypothetical protein